jgi:hypothetical protein
MPANAQYDYKISIIGESPKEVYIAFTNPVAVGEFIKFEGTLAKVIYVIHSFGESEIIASKNINEAQILARLL